MAEDSPTYTFKNQNRSYYSGGKKFLWKSLKQILTPDEKDISYYNSDILTYYTLNAPPSLRPAKKYSDISGLIAPYTDPISKLYYHNSEEYATVMSLPSDITAGYLALRGASSIVG